jgi:hypothetical protein
LRLSEPRWQGCETQAKREEASEAAFDSHLLLPLFKRENSERRQ